MHTSKKKTTIAISKKDSDRLAELCNYYDTNKKEFLSATLAYLDAHKIDPRTAEHPDTSTEKILKRISQLFGFIKQQEKEYLRPSVRAITLTERRIQEGISNTINQTDLSKVTRHIDAQITGSEKRLINTLSGLQRKIEIMSKRQANLIMEVRELKEKRRGFFS